MNKVTNKDLLIEMAKSKETGVITETLGKMMVYIAHRYANQDRFVNYSFKEDMIQEAIMRMSVSYSKFKPELSDNPFAYLATVTTCSFTNMICKERKQKQIAEDFDRMRKEVV